MEKSSGFGEGEKLPSDLQETGQTLNVTEADLLEAKDIAQRFTLDDTRRVSVPRARGIAVTTD